MLLLMETDDGNALWRETSNDLYFNFNKLPVVFDG
jgi:hypothetical protein